MKIIYNQRAITIDWLVKAGINNVEEDFTGADIVCILGGPTDRYHVTATYNPLNRGHISITIPASTLASGVYDARLMWFKTRGGVIRNEQGTKVMQRCDLSYIFAITNVSGEDNTGEVISSTHTEHLSSVSEPFGRDGMSAYEIACLRENTTLTEAEWIKTYEEAEDRVNYQFDSSHADGWAALFNSDHSRAGTDHSTATTDHSTATTDHSTSITDHSTATTDHSTATTDHSTATTDHSVATNDHSISTTDHNTATADHNVALADHASVVADHTIASADHSTASNDHTIAAADHATSNTAHTRADQDHTIAAADHATSGSDHAQAQSNHVIAGTDHTTAASDHTIATQDHTYIVADHAQYESDHTRANEDHERAQRDYEASKEDRANKVTSINGESTDIQYPSAKCVYDNLDPVRDDVASVNVDELGDAHAKSIDLDELPKVCGYPLITIGSSQPNVTPDFIGQFYVDTTNAKIYMASGVSSAADFKVLN